MAVEKMGRQEENAASPRLRRTGVESFFIRRKFLKSFRVEFVANAIGWAWSLSISFFKFLGAKKFSCDDFWQRPRARKRTTRGKAMRFIDGAVGIDSTVPEDFALKFCVAGSIVRAVEASKGTAPLKNEELAKDAFASSNLNSAFRASAVVAACRAGGVSA